MDRIWVAPIRGRKLLDKIWVLPVGLWQEVLSEYGALVSFLTGGFVVGLIVLVIKLAGRLF